MIPTNEQSQLNLPLLHHPIKTQHETFANKLVSDVHFAQDEGYIVRQPAGTGTHDSKDLVI